MDNGYVRKIGLVAAGLIVLVAGIYVLGLAPLAGPERTASAGDVIPLDGSSAQAAAFIEKYNSIVLTTDQLEVRKTALSAIPAPCCRDYSIETCCCPCNLAKAVWGLSASLIAEHGLDAPAVRAEVEKWIHLTNPKGYTGDACYEGRCGKSFEDNGCGGMREDRISLAR